jgi:hypothetical protein
VADEEKSVSRINLAIIIPAVVAIVAALMGFMATVYVGYLSNQGTLQVEQRKERAEAELEQQKFKTSLILEAVKVGDKQKALDNLTFFIDAGFLDDPGGKIKALLNKNVPVLPIGRRDAYSYDDYSSDGGPTLVFPPAAKELSEMNPDAAAKELARVAAAENAGKDFAKEGDELAGKGDSKGAFLRYRTALMFIETHGCDTPSAAAVRDKMDKLPGKQAVPPCREPMSRILRDYFRTP